MSEEQAKVTTERARSAALVEMPHLDSPMATGAVIEVAKVVTLQPREPLSWIVTTDGTYQRLPDALNGWAIDVFAGTLSAGGVAASGMFPARIEFGVLRGRPYAEFLTD